MDYIAQHAPYGLSFEKINEFVSEQHNLTGDRRRLRYASSVLRWNEDHPVDEAIDLIDWGEFADTSAPPPPLLVNV
jgi:hypothetical protein